jgi:hypothetical protein
MSEIMADFPLLPWRRIAIDLEDSKLQQAGKRKGCAQEDENARLGQRGGDDGLWAS